MKYENATWILEKNRPDLVKNWVEAHQHQVSQFLQQAQTLSFGGLDDKSTPGSVHLDVGDLRKKAVFVFLLVEQAFEDFKSGWTAEEFRHAMIAFEQARKAISMDVNAIAKLHTMIGKIANKTESLTSGPLPD